MPDWKPPFSVPHMTTEKFIQMKRDYVAKHGYRYSIPGFDDVVHLGFEEPISKQEYMDWKKRDPSLFTPERYEEIKYMKNQKREKFLDLLGSPTPEVFLNRGAIMTAVDDVEDSMSTLAVAGKVIAGVGPRWLAKLIAGPAGWLLVGAELLDALNLAMAPERLAMKQKRKVDSMTENNPHGKKAAARKAKNLFEKGINKGQIIEAMQVADSMFGVGLSLGTIMNLPLDIISGAARRMMGQRVTVNYPVPDVSIWKKRAMIVAKAGSITPYGHAVMTGVDIAKHYITHSMSNQVLSMRSPYWDPIEQVKDLNKIEIKVSQPTNPLTIEVMNEEDPDWRSTMNWPQTGKEWATINQIADGCSWKITTNLREFSEQNKHNLTGWVGASAACDAAFNSITAMFGPDSASYDYSPSQKAVHSLLNGGYMFPHSITDRQIRSLKGHFRYMDRYNRQEALGNILSYAKRRLGFEFITAADF